MSNYQDFSPYSYMWDKEKNTYNIGWLEGCDFPRGDVPDEFIIKLWEYIKYPVLIARGFHINHELDKERTKVIVDYIGYNFRLGYAELRVVDDKNDVVYASPNLILHYIVNHRYLPPQEFINSVLSGPKPNSDDYSKIITKITGDKDRKLWGSEHCIFCGSKKIYRGFSFTEEHNSNSIILVRCLEESENINLRREQSSSDMICTECGKSFAFLNA